MAIEAKAFHPTIGGLIMSDDDQIPDDGKYPKRVLTVRQQREKTEAMVKAVLALGMEHPGRLVIDIEDDLIRTEKIEIDYDPETNLPLQKLQLEIETDLSLLGLGQTQDMAEPPSHGFIVVEYRLGDTVDKELHLHFLTVEQVINYMKFRVVPH